MTRMEVRYVPAWFPGMYLKRHALKAREAVDQVIEDPFKEAKERKVRGLGFAVHQCAPTIISSCGECWGFVFIYGLRLAA